MKECLSDVIEGMSFSSFICVFQWSIIVLEGVHIQSSSAVLIILIEDGLSNPLRTDPSRLPLNVPAQKNKHSPQHLHPPRFRPLSPDHSLTLHAEVQQRRQALHPILHSPHRQSTHPFIQSRYEDHCEAYLGMHLRKWE